VLEFRILGALEVRHDGRAVELGGPRPRALLAALLARAGEPVGADELIQALWGEEAPPTAGKALQVHVSRLRRALGPAAERVETAGGGYRLLVGLDELDADRFEHGYERGRELLTAGDAGKAARSFRDALALWRGPALADVRYEPWAQPETRRLEELRALAIEERVEADLALGEHARLVGELEALVAEHPLRERLRAQQMLALYRAGRHADALAAFRAARAVLDTELGLEPGPELRRLEQSILTHDPALAAPHRPQAGVPPAPPTPTYGRDDDVRSILAALETARLLTLVGPGGVGKTRLAVEVARAAEGRFVSLASTAGVERVPAAICDALALPRIPGEPEADALERAIGREPILLVPDNLEHLPGSGALFAGLLERAPGLRILATSREPLRVHAERLFPVAPLALDGGVSPAVALFADRARAHDPAFALTAANAAAVGEVCERVGGLPLAIELAAGRLGVLSPEALAARLADALTVLDRGPRDAPARHQTLRATLDWSFELLDEQERDAFTALGAFAGGCELEAAEAVTRCALPVLEGLVAKSLVAAAGRLTMLEPVRQYAAERLAARPDADAVRARHFAYYLALAERTEHRLWIGGSTCPEFAEMHRERDNMRAAMSWAVDSGAAHDALALAGELGTYATLAHANHEADDRARRALAVAGSDAPARLRARALLAITHTTADDADREEPGTTALELFRSVGDDTWTARTLLVLSNVRSFNGDYATGRALAEEALGLAERLGDDVLIGAALGQVALGIPRVAEAFPLVSEAAARLRRAGAPQRAARMLSTEGMAALREDEYEVAEKLQAQALDAALEVAADAHTLALVYGNAGLAALLAGRQEPALAAFRNELATAHAHAFATFYFEGLLGIAAVAAARGEDHRAVVLETAAWKLSDGQLKEAEVPVYERVMQRFIAPARERLGAEAREAASAAASAMTADAAIALALEPAVATDPLLPSPS
jgi:predicted ATPase/DNA-binding SARP family transcriptional activator